MKYLTKSMTLALSCLMVFSVQALSPESQSVADYAVKTYEQAMLDSLTKLVSFKTVATEGMTPDNDPEFIGFKAELKQLALELDLSYSDHGYVLLIGLGEHGDKLGVITHGDVQPANPKLWAQDPFILDTQSQPGQLIGRGTEDDKGAVVTAMYAMKSIKDKQLNLNKRIELLVYLAEESDWDPLKAFLKTYTPAEINITIDAEYPVVTAEKGWSQIAFTVPNIDKEVIDEESVDNRAELQSFSGGYFSSQIPQQAKASLLNVPSSLLSTLKSNALKQKGMLYRFERQGNELTIFADGKAAHSSSPEDGVNAVTHLAQLLSNHPWPKSQASLTQAFIHELVGLGIEAEQFGDIAYRDDFMGPMTLAPTVVEQTDAGTKVTLNLRRPVGKTPELLDIQTTKALKAWQTKHDVSLLNVETHWGKPMVMEDAPHLKTLLAVFSHFTGVIDPQPVAIGGSTNSKLFPNALSFGPTMPDKEYTGHTENEFMTQEQFMLNLKMYTAAFIELAVEK